MANVYRVYDVTENTFVAAPATKEEAIAFADGVCSLQHTAGKVFEVHEFDESDTQLAYPQLVHSCRG